jgi:hypothetical protein
VSQETRWLHSSRHHQPADGLAITAQVSNSFLDANHEGHSTTAATCSSHENGKVVRSAISDNTSEQITGSSGHRIAP